MSGIDECTSQEIEASTSSNSTRNSKKYSFVESILNAEKNQMLCGHGRRIIFSGERVPLLPTLEKRNFVENWIIAHSDLTDSPEKPNPASPILGISPAKRSPQSPILGYRWKRMKRETDSKENCRVSLNKKLQDAASESPVNVRIKIENESLQYSEAKVLECFNNDSDKTLISENCPVLNGITNSPTLNASRISCKPRKFNGDSTLKWHDRRSLTRESSKVPEALSLSSPLCERNERLKIEDSTNYSKRNIQSLNKQSQRLSELLVDESPSEVEIISSSSNIPETLSLSTIVDECERIEVESKTRNDLKENVNINKLERLHRRSLCLSPIKTDDSSNHYRRSSVRDSSNSLDRLSMPSPLSKTKFIGIKSHNIRTNDNPVKSEAVETSQGFDTLSNIRESSKLPQILSASSQLDKNLVSESLNSANCLPLSSPLSKKVPIDINSVNTSWIRAKNNSAKSEAVSTQCIDRLHKIRASSKSNNLLISSQPGESEGIDIESYTTNPPEDDNKIESDSDATISDFIENVETQNIAAIALRNSSSVVKNAGLKERPPNFIEQIPKPRRVKSCDSDETYYSDGDSIPRLRTTETCSLKNSQKISQTSHSHEGRVSANRSEILISEATSSFGNSNSESPANVASLNTTNNHNKRKKKGKKGSFVAKLQTIVSSQISNLHIWRYQMSQPNFKVSHTQFVILKIRDRETRYGRHYLKASVIEDSHNLLKSLFESQNHLSSKKSESSSQINSIMLMMIPEVIGVVKIRVESILKIYPPWEIMDSNRKILNIMFFNVIARDSDNIENKTVIIRENKKVIEEFECPCIRAKALVDSCPVKFSNTKPSVMQEMFGS